ncbi:cobalamin biosynthesis protein [Meiothermus sp.]|uniref:cobalamin biosynthesis protein n=1 Tax=Meiothermus sp. TaxID=1955249 RepID=UPI00345E0319
MGRWAARTDHLLKLLPARFTALLLWAATLRFRWWKFLHGARKTPLPSLGWPMTTLAGALAHPYRRAEQVPGRCPAAFPRP